MMDTSKTYTNAAILFAVLQTEAGTLILRGKDVEIEISRSPIRCTPSRARCCRVFTLCKTAPLDEAVPQL